VTHSLVDFGCGSLDARLYRLVEHVLRGGAQSGVKPERISPSHGSVDIARGSLFAKLRFDVITIVALDPIGALIENATTQISYESGSSAIIAVRCNLQVCQR
jgi:hypothetical protein